MECLFCRIIGAEIPAKVVYDDESWLVIHDINPQAPLHLLFICKQHVSSFAAWDEETARFSGLITAVHRVAQQLQVQSYRLLTNVGPDAGQSIEHLHWHFLAGKDMGDKLA